MKKVSSVVCIGSIAAGLFILSGCSSSTMPSAPTVPDGTTVEKNSQLFVTDSGSGVVTFLTNDARYNGYYGYTLWTETSGILDPFSHLNVTFSKMSGNAEGGYGVVFCSHDNTMLLVLLNTQKEYLIGELTGNVFTALQDWTETQDLYLGYNQTNIVDITRDSGTGVFSLAFNGGDPVFFRDDEEPYHSGGRNGYIVVVSPLDTFPDVPVMVTFKTN